MRSTVGLTILPVPVNAQRTSLVTIAYGTPNPDRSEGPPFSPVPSSNLTHINVSAVLSGHYCYRRRRPVHPFKFHCQQWYYHRTVMFFPPPYEFHHCRLSVMLMHAICRSSVLHSMMQGSRIPVCIWMPPTETPPVLILACHLGHNKFIRQTPYNT